MNRKRIRSTAVATGAASLLLLTAVTPATAAAPGPAPVEQCDGLTGPETIAMWGPQLEDHTPAGSSVTHTPDLAAADADNLNPCHGLSAVVVPYTGSGAAGEIGYSHVMLFHDGEYLGTATDAPRQYIPQIELLDQDTLTVEYGYGKLPDRLGPAHTALSTFTWNDETGSVDHTGEFPPEA